jgi:hypothetical protein
MPNTSDIAMQHGFLVGALRFAAILGAWAGSIPLTMMVAFAIRDWDFSFYNIGPPSIVGLCLILPAMLIWVIAPAIARFALPNALRSLCPSCGYDLKDSTNTLCTECGLTLTEEFRQGVVLPGPSQLPPGRIFVLQGLMAGVARLIGAIVILPCLGIALSMALWTIQAVSSFSMSNQAYYTREAVVFGGGCVIALAGAGFCLIPWFWPRRVGRLLVRMPKESS